MCRWHTGFWPGVPFITPAEKTEHGGWTARGECCFNTHKRVPQGHATYHVLNRKIPMKLNLYYPLIHFPLLMNLYYSHIELSLSQADTYVQP
jgi:hypothetical protein